MKKRSNITFKNTSDLYWKCQLVGWSLASLYWAYQVYFRQDYSPFYTLLNFVLDVFIGVSLTHSYKLIIQKSNRKLFNNGSLFYLAIAILILSVLFMLLVNLKWYIHWDLIRGESKDFVRALFFWDQPLITGLRLMTIWVLAYHLYQYYKQQMALSAHNASLSILTKQIQLDHLSNQLNPHFLFNSLNSVKSLISENPTKAKRSIDLLSELLRSSIYSKERLTTIEEEVQLIHDYIELEKLRFEERLELKVSIDESLLSIKIPSLCIQTLIENALKHGIQKSIKGGTIILSINKNIDHLKILVQNPGQLMRKEDPKKERLGLENLKERLFLEYKDQAKFSLVEYPEGMITSTITIPLKIESS